MKKHIAKKNGKWILYDKKGGNPICFGTLEHVRFMAVIYDYEDHKSSEWFVTKPMLPEPFRNPWEPMKYGTIRYDNKTGAKPLSMQ